MKSFVQSPNPASRFDLPRPPAPAGTGLEDFELAFESLLVRFQVTVRQIDRFASGIDDRAKLKFLDELISRLLFFEMQSDLYDPESPERTLEALPGDRLIETAIWLCEKSAEAESQFHEVRLAKRLRALAESCHDTYHELPDPWKNGQRPGFHPIPSRLEAVAA